MNGILFKKISSDDMVIDHLAKAVTTRLDRGKKVLWLVSGGSAIKIAVGVSRKLKHNPNLTNLAVSLIDERYGPPGHPDSNWGQLKSEGFHLDGAIERPILEGENRQKTTQDFALWLNQHLRQADYRIGLLGMGPDGHTSGILPGSPAVESGDLVSEYQGPDFQRITSTPKVLAELDEVVVYALGEAKWPQLDRLEETVSTNEQPVQALKRVKKVTIFNDYKGEPA